MQRTPRIHSSASVVSRLRFVYHDQGHQGRSLRVRCPPDNATVDQRKPITTKHHFHDG